MCTDFWSCNVQGNGNVKAHAAHGQLKGTALGTNCCSGQKTSSEGRGNLGWLSTVFTWKWRHHRVFPEWEEFFPDTGGTYTLPVGRLSNKAEGLVSHRKGLRKGRRVIYVQLAAFQALPSPALILEHSHCFGTLWNFLPYFLAYAHNFLASLVTYLFCVCLILILCFVAITFNCFSMVWDNKSRECDIKS